MLNFPGNPTNGQIYSPYAGGHTYVWDSGDGVWRFSTAAAPPPVIAEAPADGKVYVRENAVWAPIPKVTVSPTVPPSPDPNDLWIDGSGLPTMMMLMATSPPPPVVGLTAVYITDAPSNNVVYARENTTWVPMPKITAATTAPSTPDVGDLWVDTN